MNFEFYNSTKLIFGAGRLSQLGQVATEYGKKALIVTGGGSVKRSGTFDRAAASLTEAGMAFAECGGVEPNPRITSVVRGARIARDEGCDVVIALGGGSTMDAAKAIAAAVLYEGDPWDMIGHGQDNWHIPTILSRRSKTSIPSGRESPRRMSYPFAESSVSVLSPGHLWAPGF
jgi:alcohol dehydrogenase YqhD (iron-dependent ADH family)